MDIRQYIASGIIEMYVMGLCSREEEAEVQRLRRQYPELHDAIVRYEEEMETNMLQNSTLPGEDTDKKILETLDHLATPVVPINRAGGGARKLNWWRVAAVVVTPLLVASLVLNYVLYKNKDAKTSKGSITNNSTLPAEDYEIMMKPTITPVAMYGVGTHAICRCTMYWDKKTGEIYIMIHHLPYSPQARNYQLWAMVDGQPVSIGVIDDKIRGRFIRMEGVPTDAIAFSVTLEQQGGSVTPTEKNTYLHGQI